MKGVSISTLIKVIAAMLLLSLVLLAVYAGKAAPEAEHEHTFKEEWQILEAPTAEKEGKETTHKGNWPDSDSICIRCFVSGISSYE